MRRCIVTHKQPDADALAATWLAERFLFAGEAVEIQFVGRGRRIAALPGADCVVDVGSVYEPENLRFDHKPPAFADRNADCATGLLWRHLRDAGYPVAGLEEFIAVVREGDRNPPGKPSPELRESRLGGFHAEISRLRRGGATDAGLYADIRQYLNRRFSGDATARCGDAAEREGENAERCGKKAGRSEEA